MRFSDDGGKLASGAADGNVKLWNVKTRKSTATLEHGSPVGSLGFNGTASVLVSHGADGTLKVWDCESSALLRTIEGVSKSPACDVSPDGKLIAVAKDGKRTFPIELLDLETGELIKTLANRAHTGPVTDIRWSPDGTRLATSSSDRSAKIWDVREATLSVHIGDLDQRVNAIAWSPDGNQVVTVGGDTGAYIWDATTGKKARVLGRLGGKHYAATGVAWSPDARVVITAAGAAFEYHWLERGTIRKLDFKTTRRDSATVSLAWHPSEPLASATYGDQSANWNLDQPHELTPHSQRLHCWSNDGALTAAINDRELVVRRVDDVVLKRQLKEPTLSLRWSPRATGIAIHQSRQVTVFPDVHRAESSITISPERNGRVVAICWSDDGTKLVLGTDKSDVSAYHVETGERDVTFKLKRREQQIVTADTIAWRPGTNTFAVGTSDNYIQLYNYEALQQGHGSKTKAMFAHQAPLRRLAWSRDGHRLASAAADRKVNLWQIDPQGNTNDDSSIVWPGKLVKVLTIPHDSEVRDVRWHRDGKRLASLTDRGTITIFDSTAGHEEMQRIVKDPDSVNWD